MIRVTLERIKPEIPNRGFNHIKDIPLVKETEKNFIVWLEVERRRQLISKGQWRIRGGGKDGKENY